MHWKLKHSPKAKCSCFYLWGERCGFILKWVILFWFIQLVNVSDLFSLGSWKFLFVFVFVPVKKTITSGKNIRKHNFIEMLNKDKAKMSPALYNEECVKSWH